MEIAKDRCFQDILIHFQGQVLKFENKFCVATHNITKYAYSNLCNICWLKKLKLRTQTSLLYNIMQHAREHNNTKYTYYKLLNFC